MSIEDDYERADDVLARIRACPDDGCSSEDREWLREHMRALRRAGDRGALQREIVAAVTDGTAANRQCSEALRATEALLARHEATEARALAIEEADRARADETRGRLWTGLASVGVWARGSQWLPLLMIALVWWLASALGVQDALRAAISGGAP